jgi:hypothetical protein
VAFDGSSQYMRVPPVPVRSVSLWVWYEAAQVNELTYLVSVNLSGATVMTSGVNDAFFSSGCAVRCSI